MPGSHDARAGKAGLYYLLRRAGLNHLAMLDALGIAEEYRAWRISARTYRGATKQKWTWERCVVVAQEIKASHGDLPNLEWCRRNGHSQLGNAVFRSGHSWEDLHAAVGCFATSHFVESRNGMRWRSHPEASLSNFLYARGIEHEKGKRYGESYSEHSGRRFGLLDLHFRTPSGAWIVEIWGDLPKEISDGKYAETRSRKEEWQANNPHFLGIQFRDCYSDNTLTKKLEPFIGVIEPFRFDRPTDRHIETAHWSNADELLETCKQIAATQPDGLFPSESWLRKRGKFSGRDGETYNTLAVYIRTCFAAYGMCETCLGKPMQAQINGHQIL